jgi:hypothetical protein
MSETYAGSGLASYADSVVKLVQVEVPLDGPQPAPGA